MYNVLSLVVSHFQDRFADQKWLIYDLKREYGYYYDLSTVAEVRFEEKEFHLLSGILSEDLMVKDEKLFQQMWKEYFKAIAIKERLNPKLHKQHLPVRFWKYLTEKQKWMFVHTSFDFFINVLPNFCLIPIFYSNLTLPSL